MVFRSRPLSHVSDGGDTGGLGALPCREQADEGSHSAPNTSADGSLHALCGEEAYMLKFDTQGVKDALAALRRCFDDEVTHVRNERTRLRKCAGAAVGSGHAQVADPPSASGPGCCDNAGVEWEPSREYRSSCTALYVHRSLVSWLWLRSKAIIPTSANETVS